MELTLGLLSYSLHDLEFLHEIFKMHDNHSKPHVNNVISCHSNKYCKNYKLFSDFNVKVGS